MSTILKMEPQEEGVLVLTLNRPEKRNALNIPLLNAIREAVTTAEQQQIRTLILRGAGKVFCAGLDLEEASDPQKAHESAQTVAATLKTLATSPIVSIAAAQGAAIAGGAGILAACDLAVTTPDCKIGYPETRRGLVAGLVMTFIIRQIGERRARDLLLTGRLINGTTAFEWGLSNGVCSESELNQFSTALAKEVCLGAPQATAHSKKLLNTMHPPTIEQDIQLALEHHMKARGSSEAEEGISAFLEKRAPNWTVSV